MMRDRLTKAIESRSLDELGEELAAILPELPTPLLLEARDLIGRELLRREK